MGHETIYRRKNLTRGALKQFIKPYLLRGLEIDRANQVWFSDITYIPMAKGLMYMTAYIDVYSIKIMGWVSTTQTKDRSIRVPVGQTIWREKETKYQWIAKDVQQTVFGSSASGKTSNTTIFI